MQQFKHKFSNRPLFHSAALVLLIALFVGLAAVFTGSSETHAGAPAVQITPNSGPYGTITVVTGQGFAPHEQVAIYRGSRPFFAYNTDANGSFIGNPHPLMGPGPVSGIIPITATGRTSGLKASTVFTVTTK
jgi:hypothetical protein